MTANELDSLHNLTQRLLIAETRLVDGLIHSLDESQKERSEEDQLIIQTILLMLQSMGVSINSVAKLTETVDMSVKDCFSISRTVIESAINIAYIATSDTQIAQRARTHAFQKRYRDLKRSGSVAGIHMSVERDSIPDIDSIAGLKEALDLFTDKNGNEIRDWSPTTHNEKIEQVKKVSERAALCLASAKFGIYRHSSEILHGTYFGTIFFWTQGSGKPVTKDTFKEHWTNNLMLNVFTSTFFASLGAIHACAKRFELPNIIAQANSLYSELNENFQIDEEGKTE